MKQLNTIVADLEYCNREIKFKAWDLENKKMFTVKAVYPWYKSESGYMCRVQDGATERPTSSVVLMQYTGRKDKNGVEIYDGDILESSPTYKGVRWFIQYRTDSEFVGYVPVEIGKKESHLSRFINWNHLEVIGNIYENPELLKNNIISLEEVNKNI